MWNSKDLVRRIDRALDFAEAAISLVGNDRHGIDLEALEALPDKIIAETAMFLRAVASINVDVGEKVRARAMELTKLLIPHARHERVQIGVALFPALALDYGAAHIVLKKAGRENEKFDGVIRTALNSTTATARERFPHRELEQAWLASLLDGKPFNGNSLDRTALIRGIDVISGSRDDGYSLTHALMYSTDFGQKLPGKQLASVDITSISRSALAGALDDDDFDLAGEFLLSWPFLRADWDDVSSFAFGVLAMVEDEVGVLPSLAFDAAEYGKLPVESRKNYVAAVAYHTAFVMGLLCTASVSSGKPPKERPAGKQANQEFTEHLLESLRQDKRRPQWLRYAEHLPAMERNSCASFFLDTALRRSLRRKDFSGAYQLLGDADKYCLSNSTLCVQAAEMLARLAQFV
jgi:hypothetical protein